MSLFDPARRLWRSLAPPGLRMGAQPLLAGLLEAQVRKAAEAPHEAEAWRGPVRVVGWFEASHGIAASARQAARAFEALGVPVERVDVTGARLDWLPPPQPALRSGPWIFHLNPPEMLAALAQLDPRRLRGPRYGYWAWELPAAPPSWLKDSGLVEEIWAPSHYTAEAFAHAGAPVRVVPHPFFLEDYRDVAPAPRAAGFLAVGLFDFNSSMARKNPDGTIAAFAKAFGEDPTAQLILKTQNGARFPEALAALRASAPANVTIEDGVWPYARVKSLIAAADVLISLHRAEGFGLTPAEAMALGAPAVATAWSGNLDFMDETCALMIPATQTAVEDPQGIYRGQTWAEPDLEAAAEALRRLRLKPELGRRLAEAGRRRIAERLSPQAWFATLPDAVQQAALAAKRG
ncbi:glycosyltransferase family 4 protein [Phenylobacterium aquaticum]|uniref:glycosyltransferase family 4 protein n=1 Tax=Phenylobacterium aquaticum TaxID=1763816 RepID=UPI0026ED419E|nr:glycosyltransferase family 4 protein [Phenylobacterium aquaticum]